ncbi:MAG: hypothetical protein AB9900_05230 [Humidesulfovibrio sp.]
MNARARLPKALAAILAATCLALLAAPAQAEEVKRYRPVVVQSGDNNLYPSKVLIVDTRDGHLWLWQERGKRDAQEGAGETQLIYQGKVAPGRAAGDVISATKRK